MPAYHFAICDVQGTKMGVCDLRIGHHYAGKACQLLFELGRRHDLEYVIITCNLDNYASRRTCEYAGGELIEIAEVPEGNDMRERGETEKCIYRFMWQI